MKQQQKQSFFFKMLLVTGAFKLTPAFSRCNLRWQHVAAVRHQMFPWRVSPLFFLAIYSQNCQFWNTLSKFNFFWLCFVLLWRSQCIWCNGFAFCVCSRSSVLLLAPLLAQADSAPRHEPWPPGSDGAQGRNHGLCSHFRWMADNVPAFRVPGARVHILTSPDQFYQAMKVGGAVWNEESCFWHTWQMMDVSPAVVAKVATAAAASNLAAASSPPDTLLHVVRSNCNSALLHWNSVLLFDFPLKASVVLFCFFHLRAKQNASVVISSTRRVSPHQNFQSY